jgi:hypothetical protein
MIRDIEGEISDAPILRKKLQVFVVADEITISVARTDLFERPFFAGFEDARRGDVNTGLRGWRIENGR